MKITARASGTTTLRHLLEAHPCVELESFELSSRMEIGFTQQGRSRVASQGDPSVEVYGLVELIDNNPLVCADRASCPGPAATLAEIAMGPLKRAGLVAERPSAVFSFDALADSDAPQGLNIAASPVDLGTVRTMTLIAHLSESPRLEDLEDLYRECYARSFFVRTAREAQDVRDQPFAAYALAAVEAVKGAFEVAVAADADGKCGAAQLVHLFNVMAGFEEDLGTRRKP